ncbi:unnamed protein product [Heligmosomoides polygyrus]|uniref:IBB domain-containing protein n=1 Tax=Heligmosomoides polygyrus TaxID=6339 RepID=A0A183GRE1_HELPZ|nr:unnamed protein product [Heligmosomoides polygyrus]
MSSRRKFSPLQLQPTRESVECAKRFRYFRSVPTKEKLYVIEKPVEEANEISDDAGPSERVLDQPTPTSENIVYKWKLGHFHTREERKKHLEEERRRKIRNQQKLIESKISPADQDKMLLDGFVTTQEVLSQRNPDTTAKHGILSVTTV